MFKAVLRWSWISCSSLRRGDLPRSVPGPADRQCCGSIQDPVPFRPLDPGSGIGFFWIPDLGSRFPNPYFWELSDTVFGKKFYNCLKIGPNFFLQHFKNKIIYKFVKIVATKKGITTNFFHPSLLFLFLDPGSGINTPDPQHWWQGWPRSCLTWRRRRAWPSPPYPAPPTWAGTPPHSSETRLSVEGRFPLAFSILVLLKGPGHQMDWDIFDMYG